MLEPAAKPLHLLDVFLRPHSGVNDVESPLEYQQAVWFQKLFSILVRVQIERSSTSDSSVWLSQPECEDVQRSMATDVRGPVSSIFKRGGNKQETSAAPQQLGTEQQELEQKLDELEAVWSIPKQGWVLMNSWPTPSRQTAPLTRPRAAEQKCQWLYGRKTAPPSWSLCLVASCCSTWVCAWALWRFRLLLQAHNAFMHCCRLQLERQASFTPRGGNVSHSDQT